MSLQSAKQMYGNVINDDMDVTDIAGIVPQRFVSKNQCYFSVEDNEGCLVRSMSC